MLSVCVPIYIKLQSAWCNNLEHVLNVTTVKVRNEVADTLEGIR